MNTTKEENVVDSLLPLQFCGPNSGPGKINQERWKFLIDKLSENEERVDYKNLNITKLFKLYSKTTLCQWIPHNLLLLNVFRYLSGNPLILIKLKDESAFRSQLNYYSLIMDDKYLDEMPIVWTGFTNTANTFLPFILTTTNEQKELKLENNGSSNNKVVFCWNIMAGFYINVCEKTSVMLLDLGNVIEIRSSERNYQYIITEMNVLKNCNDKIVQLKIK
ncbi:hypothetical protein ABK040_013638 [Willaertia magna]